MSSTTNNIDGSAEDRMRVQVISEPAEIALISADWDDLFRRAVDATPFLSRAWQGAFLNARRFKGRPVFVLVWSGRKLIALFALALRRVFGVKVLTPIGTGLPAYFGPLIDTEHQDAVDKVVEVFTNGGLADVICIEDCSYEDKTTTELLEKLKQRGFSYRSVYRNPCRRIRLGCSFDEYLKKSKSGKRRYKLRFEERKLFESGDVKVMRYKGAEITPDINMRAAVIQRESWMKERGAAVLGRKFYQELMSNAAAAGMGRVWLMTINGEDAAFGYGLVSHRQLHYYWPAFKLKFLDTGSIGHILLLQVIRDACNDGIELFDFGHGDSEYKRYWSNECGKVARVAIWRGFRGRLVSLFYYLKWRAGKIMWLRSFYHRLRIATQRDWYVADEQVQR